MNCNIVRDLIPSYVDGICSEDTATAVENHVKHCQGCKDTIQMMQQPTLQIIETSVETAKQPFKRLNKKRRLQVLTASIMSFILTIIGSLVVQDVGIVNNFFFPKVHAIVNIEEGVEDWQSIRFTDFHFNEQAYLLYGRLFGEKEIVNSADSESDVFLRIKDETGKLIIDEFQISPGKSVKLESLKRGKKYYLEIKAPAGHFRINAI